MQQKFQEPPRRVPWYRRDIEGSVEENEEAFEVASEYLYNILSYADKEVEEELTAEDLARERRIFAFCMQGPRAGHFRLTKKEKLTSADVLYILTSSLPAGEICKRFDVNVETVKEIRRGECRPWYWEYMFVRRIQTIIKNKLTRNRLHKTKALYIISKLRSDRTLEDLLYTSSIRKAKALRESILNKGDFKRMTKDGTIDIYYPIKKVDLMI